MFVKIQLTIFIQRISELMINIKVIQKCMKGSDNTWWRPPGMNGLTFSYASSEIWMLAVVRHRRRYPWMKVTSGLKKGIVCFL